MLLLLNHLNLIFFCSSTKKTRVLLLLLLLLRLLSITTTTIPTTTTTTTTAENTIKIYNTRLRLPRALGWQYWFYGASTARLQWFAAMANTNGLAGGWNVGTLSSSLPPPPVERARALTHAQVMGDGRWRGVLGRPASGWTERCAVGRGRRGGRAGGRTSCTASRPAADRPPANGNGQ